MRVDAIRDSVPVRLGWGSIGKTTLYDVTNTATGRKTTFRSAAKFRGPALSPEAEAQRRAAHDKQMAADIDEVNALLRKCPLDWTGSIHERLLRLEAEHPGTVPERYLKAAQNRDQKRAAADAEPDNRTGRAE